MNRITVILLAIVFLFCTGTVMAADKVTKSIVENSAFGVIANGHYSSAHVSKGEDSFEYDLGYGAGFVFERMFNNTLGIHSNITFNIMNLKMRMTDSSGFKAGYDVINYTINFPLLMNISLNTQSFSFSFLIGPTFLYFITSEMTKTDSTVTTTGGSDILRYMQYFQVGAAAGMQLKFRVGMFTDFFVGGVTEYYFTKLIKDKPDSFENMYSFRTFAGFMFRTNVFPIQPAND